MPRPNSSMADMNPALLQELLGVVASDPRQMEQMRQQLSPLFGGPRMQEMAALDTMWNTPGKPKKKPPTQKGPEQNMWDILMGQSPVQHAGYPQGAPQNPPNYR